MKRILVTLLATCAIILGIVCAAPRAHTQNTAAPAADAQKTAEQVFKNIQSLKGTPADQLQPSM